MLDSLCTAIWDGDCIVWLFPTTYTPHMHPTLPFSFPILLVQAGVPAFSSFCLDLYSAFYLCVCVGHSISVVSDNVRQVAGVMKGAPYHLRRTSLYRLPCQRTAHCPRRALPPGVPARA